jgi:hypothetical protein
MRLQDFLQLNWVTNLFEVLDTKPDKLSWQTVDNRDIGTLIIQDEIFEIYLEPGEFGIFSYINIAFSKMINGKPSDELVLTSKSGSKIMGAIINSLDERLNHYEPDAVIFTAVDNVEKRMSLYNRCIRFFKFINYKDIIRNIKIKNGMVTVVIISDRLNKKKQELLSQIDNLVNQK